MPKALKLAVACLGAGALIAAPAAASKTSSVIAWKNPKDTFDCGIAAHPKSKPAKQLICSADAVPNPKGVRLDGDPALELGAHGKPKLIESHDSSFVSTHEVALAVGTTWKSVGVTCSIGAKVVTCKNKDKHGFTMGHVAYKTF